MKKLSKFICLTASVTLFLSVISCGGGGGSDKDKETGDIPVTGVSLDKTPTDLAIGSSITLTATITPAVASNETVTWETSDSSQLLIKNGGLTIEVFAVGCNEGAEQTITVTTGDGGFTAQCTVNVDSSSTVFSADGASFKMGYIPKSMMFDCGPNDSGTIGNAYGYWIAETEVIYALWKKVYDWATVDAGSGTRVDGGILYSFDNAGREGNDGTVGAAATNNEPVTFINWYDAILFCNAMTEWYNANNSTSFTCAYLNSDDASIIREVTVDNEDKIKQDFTTNGFCLPINAYWELAARWRKDSTNTESGYSNPWFTKGDSASGATADYTDAAVTGLVAVYNTTSTAEVKTKDANSLGLYDMSGNVWEWCFGGSSSTDCAGYARGSGWSTADETIEGITSNQTLGIGTGCSELTADTTYDYVGIRLSKFE